MLNISLLCVGKMRERFYIEAMAEYEKRLKAFCRFDVSELPESALPDRPSPAEIESALLIESKEISRRIPKGAYTIAMCIEGKMLSSEDFSRLLKSRADSGNSMMCFLIGGSYGLHGTLKAASDFLLSMSSMTFPHHLARVILAEQLYRGFMIDRNGKYHK